MDKTTRETPKKETTKTSTSNQPFVGIRKRDGRVVPFDQDKITEAIFKALRASGVSDYEKAKEISDKVVSKLISMKLEKGMPTVESVQDAVEAVLIEAGYAKVAKAYILYRQKRAEIREEKQKILEKEEIDEVDKRFDLNALRVLRARYLKKNEQGRVIESPAQLFERVATHVLLPSLLYDQKVFVKKGKALPEEKFDPVKSENKYAIGRFKLNRFHLIALKRIFDRANAAGEVKISWKEFIDLLSSGYFDKYAPTLESFYELMVSRRFLPNTPAIANFGNYLGMGSACFVLGIEDSIDSIMDTLKSAAVIFKAGGGVGYNFSDLRPEGDFVKSTGGTASGPLSFMTMFDNMTDVVKQGGIRRGANMGILNINHPDIEKFITAKEGNKALRNFNISVMVMPDFWEALEKKKPYPLVNPRTGETVRSVNPQTILDRLVYQAWESAEPGVLFHDRINEYNPFLKSLGPINSTNPCGEVLLYPYESCNLGSVNVWSFVKEDGQKKKYYDWEALGETVRAATRFLDNVIDINNYPMPEIEKFSLSTRKVGLGVMGVGDLLYELDLPYNSAKGLEFMEELMEFINYSSKLESIELAKERGSFPLFKDTFFPDGQLPFSGYKNKERVKRDWKGIINEIKENGLRNSYTTVIAPTGSISMIAGTSSGMEPVFSLVFEKNVSVGSFYYVDPVFEERMSEMGLLDDAMIREVVSEGGSVQGIDYIPDRQKKIFATAMDIDPKDHIRALAAFQKWTDSSISKTINFPADATVDQMKEGYLLAYQLGCKGSTVFRDSSIQNQVLVAGTKTKEEKPAKGGEEELKQIEDVKAEGPVIYQTPGADLQATVINGISESEITHDIKFCPKCQTELINKEGCKTCPNCGWGLCL
jgi:ribonucleoside-diphosphate reductase alpha chain